MTSPMTRQTMFPSIRTSPSTAIVRAYRTEPWSAVTTRHVNSSGSTLNASDSPRPPSRKTIRSGTARHAKKSKKSSARSLSSHLIWPSSPALLWIFCFRDFCPNSLKFNLFVREDFMFSFFLCCDFTWLLIYYVRACECFVRAYSLFIASEKAQLKRVRGGAAPAAGLLQPRGWWRGIRHQQAKNPLFYVVPRQGIFRHKQNTASKQAFVCDYAYSREKGCKEYFHEMYCKEAVHDFTSARVTQRHTLSEKVFYCLSPHTYYRSTRSYF